jgi:hypothetical protein
MDKYKKCVVEMKEIISAPMDQHMFHYSNTCEELFYQWSNMKGIIYCSRTSIHLEIIGEGHVD